MNTDETSKSDFLPKRIPEIDGLRGIAIIGVVVCHFFGQGIDYEHSHWFANSIAEISLFGGSGVYLFFVISGFLIGGILLDNKDSNNYFRTFYARRIFRIFPLYYGLIILFYGLTFLSANKIFIMPDWLFGFTFSGKWYLTFTQNIAMAKSESIGAFALAPTWSLAVEEQFYLTLPFIVRFISRKYLMFIVVTLIFIAPLFRSFIWIQTSSTIAVTRLMPSCLDALMIGVLIAILFRSKKCNEIILKFRQKLIFPVFLVIFFIWQIISSIIYANSPILAANGETLGYTSLSFIFGYLLISAVISKSGSLLSKILCDGFLRKVGELSYFIYLFHILIYLIIHWQLFGIINKPPFGWMWFLEISLTLSVILVLAQLSFQFFEKPLINYGHSFKYENREKDLWLKPQK